MSNEQKILILKNKKDIINSISPSFCSAKWLQTTLYLQNGYNHSCHHPSPHKIPLEEIESNPAALHNSKFKKQQRAKMLKGERPSECDYCWKIEDLDKDYFSDRHYKTADYWAWDRLEEIAKSDPSNNVYPAYLEVSFSNACNMKCSYCSPEISSKWLEEIKQYGPYPIPESNQDIEWYKKVGRYPYKHSDENPYVDAFWKWFPDAIKHLKVFRITGGEPLLSKDFWKIFDFIKTNPQPDLELAINTNLSTEDILVDKLVQCINEVKGLVKKIDIYTSLESTGKKAEYSRFGLDYDRWNKNIRRILSDTDCVVGIMTTINILSITDFNNFLDVVIGLRKDFNESDDYNRIPLSVNYLRWPGHLSVKLLPQITRERLAAEIFVYAKPWLKTYERHRYARLYLEEWDQIQRLCDYLKLEEDVGDRRKYFINFINEYDRRRNTNFVEIFPEYKKWYEEWDA